MTSCGLSTTACPDSVEDVEDRWLDPGEGSRGRLQALLTPYPAGEMDAYDVASVVNNAGHDSPDCIAPAQS